jgi:hypothetical protein
MAERRIQLGAPVAVTLVLLMTVAWCGCGGKYDKPLETDMSVTGGLIFASFESEGALRHYFADGEEIKGREFTGVVRPSVVGTGLRSIAIVDSLDSLVVKVYRPGGGDPIFTVHDPKWRRIGGLAIDDKDNVYVSDKARDFVRSYDPAGNLRFEADLADSGFGIGHVLSPRGLHFDGQALLIAQADPEKAQVQKVAVNQPQKGIPFSGTVPFIRSFTYEDGTQVPLAQPVDVTTDWLGNIYVLDKKLGQIFRYTAEGEPSALVNAPTTIGPDSLRAAISIGTFEINVYVLETGTGRIHYWYSTEQQETEE